jgi:hypothetical protein
MHLGQRGEVRAPFNFPEQFFGLFVGVYENVPRRRLGHGRLPFLKRQQYPTSGAAAFMPAACGT